MYRGRPTRVESVDGVDFTGAIAGPGQLLSADLSLPGEIGAGASRSLVKSFIILSTDNLDWEVRLFSSAVKHTGDLNRNTFLGVWQFPHWHSANSYYGQVVDAGGLSLDGLWYYYIDGNDIYYEDEDATKIMGGGVPPVLFTPPKLHLELTHRTWNGAKAAYPAGHFRLIVNMEPVFGAI